MTLDECDELLEDLRRAGVDVRTVRFDWDTGWKIFCWHPDQNHGRWIYNARRFRAMVKMGWIPGIPKDAFDRGGYAVMSKDECDELVADLRAINVDVGEVKLIEETGGWGVCVWSERTHWFHWITDARVFRELVHVGLTPVLPKGALDKKLKT